MVFLDNASTTRMYEEINNLLFKYNNIEFYNPGGLYRSGSNIANDILNSRNNIIKMLGGKLGDNFVFTSGATEANNMVLNFAKKFKKGKILISNGEHPSVYNGAVELKNQGYDIEFLDLDKSGKVDVCDYQNKLTPDVVFVSVMHVSNETGAINPIAKMVKMAKNINKNIIFHADGVQAIGKTLVNVSNLNVDLYTISGHKIHAPKGIGGLFVKSGIALKPLLFGGGQEGNIRSGTENVGGIFALECALSKTLAGFKDNYDRITKLKRLLIEGFDKFNSRPIIVSDDDCTPYIISILFKNLRGETLLHKLDDEGFMVGNGSACSTKKKGNRVLSNMGYSDDEIEGALRISFSYDNSEEEILEFLRVFNKVIDDYKKGTGR